MSKNFDITFEARQRSNQMRQRFAVPLILVNGVVQYAGNFDFIFDVRQKWSQVRSLHFYNTFEWC